MKPKLSRNTIHSRISNAATDKEKLRFAQWGKDGLPPEPFPTVAKYLRKGDWLRRMHEGGLARLHAKQKLDWQKPDDRKRDGRKRPGMVCEVKADTLERIRKLTGPMDYERLTRLRELTTSNSPYFEKVRAEMVIQFAKDFLGPMLNGDEEYFFEVARCIKQWKGHRKTGPFADNLAFDLLKWKFISKQRFSIKLFREEYPFHNGVPDNTVYRSARAVGLWPRKAAPSVKSK